MAEQRIVKGTIKKGKPHPKVKGVAQKYKHPKKEDPDQTTEQMPKSRMSAKQHATNYKRKIRKTHRSSGSK